MSTAVEPRLLEGEAGELIAAALPRELRAIESVRPRATLGGGYEVLISLEPVLISSRAEQQGLKDPSVGAAAADPRLQRAISAAVERVNLTLPEGERIVSWSILT